MPLGYLRRPLFLALVVYILILAALHAHGAFAVAIPQPLLSFRRSHSVRLEGLVVSPLREDFRGEKAFLRAGRADGVPFSQKILVYLPRGAPNRSIRPGQNLVLEGRLRLPRAARNPGEFDERAFLADRGAAWIMKAERFERGPEPVAWRWLPAYGAEAARRSLQDCFQRLLSEEEARLMTGMTLGYKGPLRRELNRAIQDAGVIHLLVPSGAKVAFVLMASTALAFGLGLGRLGSFLFSGAIGGFYVLMVGADPPYVRAYLAAAVVFGGYLLERDTGAFQAVVLSAWAILLLDPRALFSAGFQMTYLAMAGLVAVMPTLPHLLPSAWPNAAKRLAATVAVTVVVELMLWPVFANTFGRGSIIGALANVILVPASGLLMASGFGVWAFSFLGETAALRLLVRLVKVLLMLFCRICLKAASLPGAAVDLAPMPFAGMLVYYSAVFALLAWPRKKASAALALAAVLFWGGERCLDRAAPLSAVYLRLPKARAALVAFSGRRHWLVFSQGAAGPILKALKFYGVSRLDKAILLGPVPEEEVGRISAAVSIKEIVKSAGSWKICEKGVCFRFNPPGILQGNIEQGAIAARLKHCAVEAATDGVAVRIKDAL